MKSYQEKLKDPRWQKKRLEILSRDNFTCQKCGDAESTLHVHHKSYNGEPWEASPESLTTICDLCHKIIELYYKHNHSGIEIMRFGNDYTRVRVVMSGGGVHLVQDIGGVWKTDLIFRESTGSLNNLTHGLSEYYGDANG